MIRQFVLRRLSWRRKAQIRRLRDRAKFALQTLMGEVGLNRQVRSEIPLIFVVGGNRSGTSLCTYVISRHPAVEVISEGEEESFSITADGHSSGFGEASHVWRSLIDPAYDVTRGEGFLWALPSLISKLYVDSVSDRDKKRLINEILAHRSSTRIPVVKSNHNSLRIPLIKDLFPQARFVLITRDYKSYVESCRHKWSKDMELGVGSADSHIDYPHIGLHWLMVNSVALYDLKKHARDDYVHIKLEELQGERSTRLRTIEKVFRFLGLEPVEVTDETMFDGTYTYVPSERANDIDTISDLVDDLIDYESSLVRRLDSSEHST